MKKKFKAKGLFLGLAAMAAGTVVSVPAFVPSQAFAATEAVDTTGAVEAAEDVTIDTESKTVVWTIRCVYKLDDGSTKPVKATDGSDYKVTRSATFTRNVTKDKKTGKVVSSGAWASAVKLADFDAPSISGYTPDKAHVDGITVSHDSNPADTIIYYTENPEHKKTAISEEKEVSRKITYYRINDDGSVSQTWAKTQRVTFTRSGVVDGNGKKEFAAWASYTLPAEDVAGMYGYTPDIKTIPDVTFTPDNPPANVNVYFRKNKVEVVDPGETKVKDATTWVVTFTDGLGNTLKTDEVDDGKSASAPAAPKREGYTFAGWDKSYSAVTGNLTVNAKWTRNQTTLIEETKHVERKVFYYYSDGKKVIDTNGNHAVTVQYAEFTRYNVKDTVTGKITNGEWQPVTWSRSNVMSVPGYTPDISFIPEVTFTPDNAPKDFNVYFTKNNPDKNYTGFRKTDGKWVYFKTGSVDRSFAGLKKAADGVWYYFTAGVQDTSFTGLAKNQNGWFYVNKGQVDYSFTGLAKNQNGWFYVNKGKVDYTFTGLAKNKNGWFYVNKGKVDYTFTGLAKNQNGWFYVNKGKVDYTFTGLAKNQNGWFYVNKGKVDYSYTGLAKNQNGWFYVKKGKVDYTYTGMCKSPKNGKWHYVNKGKVDYTYNGICKSPKNGKWYYMRNGILDYSFKGVAKSPVNGKLYYLNGVLDYSYNGTIQYEGKTYKVTKGVAELV